MKKDHFIVELIKSTPFKILIILAIIIILGIIIANRKERIVKMKENVLYIEPDKDK
jgi:hypothetical protein